MGTVIGKDMSPLGRDYLKVAYYTEFFFVERDVRCIPINDGADSAKSDKENIRQSCLMATGLP